VADGKVSVERKSRLHSGSGLIKRTEQAQGGGEYKSRYRLMPACGGSLSLMTNC
jgi:hypothetical protein